MRPLTVVTAIAAPVDEPNVDTNQLCPTRFNKVPTDAPDYQKIFFHDQRFNPDGSEKPGFLFNREPYRQAEIIVADRNWGGGSSRESAVYAMMAFGIRAVIASSFGDIHRNNCLKNGVLPVELPNEDCVALRAQLRANPGATITIDLQQQIVRGPGNAQYHFDIAPIPKRCLLNGLDDVGRTQEYAAEIDAFRETYRTDLPFQGVVSAD